MRARLRVHLRRVAAHEGARILLVRPPNSWSPRTINIEHGHVRCFREYCSLCASLCTLVMWNAHARRPPCSVRSAAAYMVLAVVVRSGSEMAENDGLGLVRSAGHHALRSPLGHGGCTANVHQLGEGGRVQWMNVWRCSHRVRAVSAGHASALYAPAYGRHFVPSRSLIARPQREPCPFHCPDKSERTKHEALRQPVLVRAPPVAALQR